MEVFSTLLALCDRIYCPPIDCPHKGPVMWSIDIFFVVNPKQTVTQLFEVAAIWDANKLRKILWYDDKNINKDTKG